MQISSIHLGSQDAQKDLRSRTGRDETNRKTQKRMERRSGKRYSSAGNEKMDRVGDKQGKMEGHCSTGQSPQRAVAPMEEEEEEDFYARVSVIKLTVSMCNVLGC